MKRFIAVTVTVLAMVTGSVPVNHNVPRGVQLQQEVGPTYEVIYDPVTGLYTIERQ